MTDPTQPPYRQSETIKENAVEHTTEMYDGLACCSCGWSGLPEDVPAHKAEPDA